MADIGRVVRAIHNLTQNENGLRTLFYACSLAAAGGVVVSGIEKKSDKRIWSGAEFAAANFLSIGLLVLAKRKAGSAVWGLAGLLGVAALDGVKFNAGTKSLGASYDELKNPNWITQQVSNISPTYWPGTNSPFPTRPLEWGKAAAIMIRDGLLIAGAFTRLPGWLVWARTAAAGNLFAISAADGVASNDVGMFSSGLAQFGAMWYLGKMNTVLKEQGKLVDKGLIPNLLTEFAKAKGFAAWKVKALVYGATAIAAWFTMIRPTIENISAPADKSKRPQKGDIQVASADQPFLPLQHQMGASLIGVLASKSAAAPQKPTKPDTLNIIEPEKPSAPVESSVAEVTPAPQVNEAVFAAQANKVLDLTPLVQEQEIQLHLPAAEEVCVEAPIAQQSPNHLKFIPRITSVEDESPDEAEFAQAIAELYQPVEIVNLRPDHPLPIEPSETAAPKAVNITEVMEALKAQALRLNYKEFQLDEQHY